MSASHTKKSERYYWQSLWAVILLAVAATLVLFSCQIAEGEKVWKHGGSKDFLQGRFENGGSNLYVNADGVIEMINRTDVNNDGYVDLVLANSHDYIERGPTDVFWLDSNGKSSKHQRMSADSGWMSRIVDLDKDGFADLIVANGENGVTSELPSYVYWGGPEGLGVERTDLATVGAYDVAVLDVNRDGYLDLIFPSAWTDHHNPGEPMLARVYLGQEDRKFRDATEQYAIKGIAAVSLAQADLNHDGYIDLVIANYREEFEKDTESFVYWGTKDGFDTKSPLRLPTRAPLQVVVADLNGDGKGDIVFSGGNRVQIYWNRAGKFNSTNRLIIDAPGYSSMFSEGAVRCDVADVNGDGNNDLIMATDQGVEVRSGNDLQKVQTSLALTHVHWVTARDLDGDGRKDLVVSRYDDGLIFDTKSAIYWNGPAGFSNERVTWIPTGGAVGNTAGDLDNDGRPEVVFNSTMSGHLKGIFHYVYLGNEDAKYSTDHRLDLPTDGADVAAIADLDLDGFPELIFADGIKPDEGKSISGLRIYQGSPDGPSPDQTEFLETHGSAQGVQVADFNRDGYLDFLVSCQVYDTKPETLAKSAAIYYGSKNGFSASRLKPIPMFGFSSEIADVNKDGYLDLLFSEKRKQILVYLGSEDGYSEDRTWKIPYPDSGPETGGVVTVADLNEDGWLDLIVTVMGHYVKSQDSLYIYYGSETGYSLDNFERQSWGYSPIHNGVADYNNDGHLDLLVSAYSSPTARVLPAQLFWGNGKTIDFDHPINLPAESSAGVLQIDLNRDGWIDAFIVCHRNDIGHQVDSLIYWNGPGGFAQKNVTRLPGLGPHGSLDRNFGNAYTRKPQESYSSPSFDMKNMRAKSISWEADVPTPTKLRFQLRWAATKEQLPQAKWTGPDGPGTYFEHSGAAVSIPERDARWLQYRAIFVSPYGCRSPKLREVRVDLKPAN